MLRFFLSFILTGYPGSFFFLWLPHGTGLQGGTVQGVQIGIFLLLPSPFFFFFLSVRTLPADPLLVVPIVGLPFAAAVRSSPFPCQSPLSLGVSIVRFFVNHEVDPFFTFVRRKQIQNPLSSSVLTFLVFPVLFVPPFFGPSAPPQGRSKLRCKWLLVSALAPRAPGHF